MDFPKLYLGGNFEKIFASVRSTLAFFSASFYLGLRFKITLIVTLVIALGILSSAILMQRFQRNYLIDVAREATTWLAQSIDTSMRHGMLNNDWGMVNNMLQAEVESGNIKNIRILDSNGIVKISTNPDEIGSPFAIQQADCPGCQLLALNNENQAYLTSSSDGSDLFVNISAISNQSRCTGCHPAEIQTLGILVIEKPIHEINSLMVTGRRIVLSILLVVFLLSAAMMVYLLRVTITQPIAELSKGVSAIGSGNFDHPVHLQNKDELSQLATTINHMRQKLKELQEKMEQRNRELSVLNKVGLATSQSLDLQQVLDEALHTVVQSLHIQGGCIYLVDEKSRDLVLCAHQGISDQQIQKIESRRKAAGNNISSQVSKNGSYLWISDISQDDRFKDLWPDLAGRSYLNIPLHSKQAEIGTLSLVTYPSKPFEEREVEVLLSAGLTISAAIENAQLYQKVHRLATLQERDRLSREIHDKLAQDLSYVNLATAGACEMLATGQIALAQEQLVQLRQVTQQTYTDVREAIFNLRTTFPTEAGFLPALKMYLDDYQTYYKLQISLICQCLPPPDFPPEITLQVTRIIQEALANVRRHAETQSVVILCQRDPSGVTICVQDDGRGFTSHPSKEPRREHFGLQIMHERADSFGGRLRIESEQGKGTSVWVWIPEAAKEKS